MSFFSWFSPKKPGRSPAAPPSSGLSRLDSTKPFVGARPPQAAPGQPANRKHERMARRELLYTVVREAMVRAGVLSSSYKFKVLSLDPRGRQFLVMVDLAQGAGQETTRLAEIEAMIAQNAKSRYDILVTAVYWRSNEHVAVGDPRAATTSRPAPLMPTVDVRPPPRAAAAPAVSAAQDSGSMPLLDVSQPAELMEAPPSRAGSRFDPLHPDEVAAFKQALANGMSAREAVAATEPAPARRKAHHGPQSYTLLTGFEDTEMAESDGVPGQALSGTQYGDLR